MRGVTARDDGPERRDRAFLEVVDLGDRDVEGAAQPVLERFDRVALVLEGFRIRDLESELKDADIQHGGTDVSCWGGSSTERAFDELDLHELDLVADLDVLEAFERHAALEPCLDVAHVFLEATQARDLAGPDDRTIARQTRRGAAPDDAVQDAAARNRAELARLERGLDLGVADDVLDLLRREQTFHRRAHLVEQLVDDVVVADLDAAALGELPRAAVGDRVEAHDDRFGGLREAHVRLVDAAEAAVHEVHAHFGRRDLLEALLERLERAHRVGLQDDLDLLDVLLGELRGQRLERDRAAFGARLLANTALARFDDFLGLLGVFDLEQLVARGRQPVEPEQRDRRRRARLFEAVAVVVD